jgi:hypothetical protein
MTEQRKGEIAIMFVKFRMRNEGLRLKDVRRDLGRVASDLGLDIEEVIDFAEPLIREVVEEAFLKKSEG